MLDHFDRDSEPMAAHLLFDYEDAADSRTPEKRIKRVLAFVEFNEPVDDFARAVGDTFRVNIGLPWLGQDEPGPLLREVAVWQDRSAAYHMGQLVGKYFATAGSDCELNTILEACGKIPHKRSDWLDGFMAGISEPEPNEVPAELDE